MADTTHKQTLDRLRAHIFDGSDKSMIDHIGFFTLQFSITELLVTDILNWTVGNLDYEKFQILARGMDPRIKCERLRQSSKKYAPMGPTLRVRLDHFEQKLIPIRNKLIHSWPQPARGRIYFCSVGHTSESKPPPESISMDELFIHSLWLNLLCNDLLKVLLGLSDGQALEIVDPQSGLPTDDPQNPLAPILRGIPGTLAQERS